MRKKPVIIVLFNGNHVGVFNTAGLVVLKCAFELRVLLHLQKFLSRVQRKDRV
jgi:hypothetical protein